MRQYWQTLRNFITPCEFKLNSFGLAVPMYHLTSEIDNGATESGDAKS